MANRVKEKWKQMRDAKHERNMAESGIMTTSIKPEPGYCITKLVVSKESTTELRISVCDSFDEDKICDNVNCPMFHKNMHYILADEKYKHLRREFLQILFRWRTR